MRIQLYKRIFLNFVLVIALFGILAAALGVVLINRNTLTEAQRRVRLDLRSAWSVVEAEQDSLRVFVTALGAGKRVQEAYKAPGSQEFRAMLESARRQSHFDFLTLTDNKGRVILRTMEPYITGDYLTHDPFVRSALRGSTVSGFAVLDVYRLRAEGGDLEEKAFMVFEPTEKAKPRAKTFESSGMAIIAASPIEDETGTRKGVIYAGTLLNRNHGLVDKIRSVVFEDQIYKGKHLGTVTVFQWDSRVATNVTLANGNKAIATRVSKEVYNKVLENNQNYYDRAFVVNDWYLSAYDPIHDIEGKVIGILYVGVLAKKYDDLKRNLWALYSLISLGAAVIVLALGFVFSKRLTESVSRLADAAGKITRGELDMKVPEPSTDDEVRDLTKAFNTMADSLREREHRLRKTNNELEYTNHSLQVVNQNYLDMLGFVSHELKNTLGVIYTSANALSMASVGKLSPPQEALVGSIGRSIDKALIMTRKYLDLARIEKGELKVEPVDIDMVKDVLNPSLEEFSEIIEKRAVTLENTLPPSVSLKGDKDLLQLVYKNLIDNALKYGRKGGRIKLTFGRMGNALRFEVWNEGEGLTDDQLSQIFEKFVRFKHETGATQSTGLGLFITKDIINKHGGNIRATSERGKWVKFIFTLPAVPLEVDLEKAPSGGGSTLPREPESPVTAPETQTDAEKKSP